VALCMRVVSTKQKVLSDSSVAYVHQLNGEWKGEAPAHKKVERAVCKDIAATMAGYCRRTDHLDLEWLARNLGVTVDSLVSLKAGRRDKYTWAFPMRNSRNEIVGIRLRTNLGKKFAERGSHQGLFIPQAVTTHTESYLSPILFLPEGPTNTAAALSIGLFAVGRPSNGAGGTDIIDFIRRNKFRKVVIFADTDPDHERPDGTHFNPGMDGAERLLGMMEVTACILPLVTKDVRSFVQNGGTAAMIEDSLKSTVWRKP